MEPKKQKSNSTNTQKIKSIRINFEIQKKIEKILNAANKKKQGRKIKLDHVLNQALDLITEEHIKTLQTNSLTTQIRG